MYCRRNIVHARRAATPLGPPAEGRSVPKLNPWMDAGFVAQSVRAARQTGLQWEQPDEAGPFSCARRARPSDAVRLAPAWNTSSLRVRAACRRTVQRRKGGGYGGWLNSYFFLFLSVSLNSDPDWRTVNRGCIHGDLAAKLVQGETASAYKGEPSTPTLPSYCQIISEKTRLHTEM